LKQHLLRLATSAEDPQGRGSRSAP
jgi:hypothetical protein